MVTVRKPKSLKRKNVGITPDVVRELDRVCQFRGWSKLEAVRRMTIRELTLIEQEQKPAPAGA